MRTNLSYLAPVNSYKTISIFFVIVILYTLIAKRYLRLSAWKITSGLLFVVFWIGLLVFFTIYNREPSENAAMKLQLFWCVREAWEYRSSLNWYFIVGNILLFLPIGVILPVFFPRMCAWWKVMLTGFLSSLVIEIIQLIFHIGLFELDDLFHNTLGAYLGYGIYLIITYIYKKNKIHKAELITAVVTWIAVIAFFAVAVYMGQPVFSYFVK